MKIVLAILIIYFVVGLIVGIVDVVRLYNQDQYLNTVPRGDLYYYVFPRKITGKHNYIFITSQLVLQIFKV